MAVRVLSQRLPLALVPLAGYKVYAAGETPQRIKAKELPIYENPEDKYVLEYTPTGSRGLESFFGSVRYFCEKYVGIRVTSERIKRGAEITSDKLGVAKAHMEDTIHHIQTEPAVLSRAAFITVAGLGGLVTGFRATPVRRGVYAVTAMFAATIICYPNQFVDVSKESWVKLKKHGKEMWKSPHKAKVEKDPTLNKPPKESEENTITVQEKFDQISSEGKK